MSVAGGVGAGFSADWLALRRDVDARARAAAWARLGPEVAQWLQTRPSQPAPTPLRVVDLGAGTGANLDWLAPRLRDARVVSSETSALPLDWTAVDADAALLARLAARGRSGDPPSLRVTRREADLAQALRAVLDATSAELITASAFIDLVSPDWIERLADEAVERRAAVLIALTYDGRVALEWPAGSAGLGDPADAMHEADRRALTAALAERHTAHDADQRRDKGFGPAAGPDAARVLREALARRGRRVVSARSDWRLTVADRPLAAVLLEGWCAIDPAYSAERTRGFIAAVERALRRGATLVVGHEDLWSAPAA